MDTHSTLRGNQTEKISERMLDTRSHWSRNERERRAQLARARQAELWSMLVPPESEPEIWAVGAATTADLARMGT